MKLVSILIPVFLCVCLLAGCKTTEQPSTKLLLDSDINVVLGFVQTRGV